MCVRCHVHAPEMFIGVFLSFSAWILPWILHGHFNSGSWTTSDFYVSIKSSITTEIRVITSQNFEPNTSQDKPTSKSKFCYLRCRLCGDRYLNCSGFELVGALRRLRWPRPAKDFGVVAPPAATRMFPTKANVAPLADLLTTNDDSYFLQVTC